MFTSSHPRLFLFFLSYIHSLVALLVLQIMSCFLDCILDFSAIEPPLSHSNLRRSPSFFLDYDFGDIFPVLQSLPSADWEGGTLVNPSPFLSSPPPPAMSWFFANAYRTLVIPKLLLT